MRLVNGTDINNGTGRVEVYVNGRWGTVCDDGWDQREATVVCRMFNYSNGMTRSHAAFGMGEMIPIWLDGVSCSGTEESLFDCKHQAFGTTDCQHKEDVGVICVDEGTNMFILPKKYFALMQLKLRFYRPYPL